MSNKEKILSLTPETYNVPKGEEQVFHAIIEQTDFDRKTGKRMSIPRIQKFGKKTFPSVLENLKKMDYVVTVLHDPIEWEKTHAAELAAKKEADEIAKREAAAKAEKEAKEAKQKEIDAAVAAQMKAMGIPEGKTIDELVAEKIADSMAKAAKAEKEAKEAKPAAEAKTEADKIKETLAGNTKGAKVE